MFGQHHSFQTILIDINEHSEIITGLWPKSMSIVVSGAGYVLCVIIKPYNIELHHHISGVCSLAGRGGVKADEEGEG